MRNLLRPLGRTGLRLTALGLGCWQFSEGKGIIGGFWEALPRERVQAIVRAALEGGMNWFDTAEAYGNGASEEALAASLKGLGRVPGDVLVATKWQPFLRRASHIRKSIGERLQKLAPFPIDLHQVHSPISFSGTRAEMEVMAELVHEGAIRSVGVSNFPEGMMRKAYRVLARHNIPLAANQIHYSLLRRKAERNGVMQAAKELGITIIAYSPLGQGILSGRHHEDPELIQSRPGPRKRMGAFQKKGLERTRPLVEALREIGDARGATPAQVALSWIITFHGDTVVAIPGASRPEQVEENLGALEVELNEEELARLDDLSRPLSGL